MNATTEVNDHPLKLIQYLHQEVATLTNNLHQEVATLTNNNNRTNHPNPTNTRNPSNASNSWNLCRRNTGKCFLSRGACSNTSMDCNMKNNGHKDASTFCDKMEGSENYCCTTAE